MAVLTNCRKQGKHCMRKKESSKDSKRGKRVVNAFCGSDNVFCIFCFYSLKEITRQGMQFATLCTIFQSLVYLKLTSIGMLSLETSYNRSS